MKLTPEEALVALRALYRTEAYHNDDIVYAGEYVEATRIVPEWLPKMTEKVNGWYVYHDGREFETSAVSRVDAINNVRFRLYGAKPAAECGEFIAVNPALVIMDAVGAVRRGVYADIPRDLFGKKTISREETAARIKRMAS